MEYRYFGKDWCRLVLKTFRNGICLPESKNTKNLTITDFHSPSVVAVPMQQHIGVPATPVVSKGDRVYVGQVIGEATSGLSCPVHASVSGTVCDIEYRPSYTGSGKTAYVIIENDFSDTVDPSIKPYPRKLSDVTTEEVIDVVKNAGVVGMGGAAFPTYAKIASAAGKAKDIIINCAECEPYITANYRLMLEEPERIIGGVKILMKALNIKCATLAVEDNKTDAAEVLSKKIGTDVGIQIELLKTKYPQGDERQLIYALKCIELPAGKLPADVGCVIFNAETCAAVYTAFTTGMPLVKKIVTVDGDAINEPKNIRVPVGTSYKDIFDFCGGTKDNISRIINGGPMMGSSVWDYNAAVMKNTSAILVLSEEYDHTVVENASCIHCGKCVSVCPMRLMPNYLAAFSKADNIEMCEKMGILSCVECGCCTYICPARVPIVQHIRNKKAQIVAMKKKASASVADKK